MNTASWRHFDILLFGAALALLALGMTLIYSGSLHTYGGATPALSGPVARQIGYAAIGIVLMILVARMDYRGWFALAPGLYGAILLALLVVLVIGDSTFGSRRWVSLAGMQFQPSEPAKLICILFLARLLTENGGPFVAGRTFLKTLVVALVP